jgi:hypothetical protein
MAMALSEVDRLTRRFETPDYVIGSTNGYNNNNYAPPPKRHERLRVAAKWLKKAGERVVPGLRVATAPVLRAAEEMKDHVFTIAAITCFDWAAFLWNDKAGLITMGVAFILFELKVSSS